MQVFFDMLPDVISPEVAFILYSLISLLGSILLINRIIQTRRRNRKTSQKFGLAYRHAPYPQAPYPQLRNGHHKRPRGVETSIVPRTYYQFNTQPTSQAAVVPAISPYRPEETQVVPTMDDFLEPTVVVQSVREPVAANPVATNPVETPVSAKKGVAYLLHHSGGSHLPRQLVLDSEHRIGRSPRLCDLVLDDIKVSRHHARLRYIDKGFYLQDEGSSGGTSINRRKLKSTEQYKLTNGDIIGFSEIYYKFYRHGVAEE